MSSEKRTIKEISDKYWSVAESIFGYTDDIDSYKLILNEPNENAIKASTCDMIRTENAALNYELFDVLKDKSGEGLFSLPADFIIKINNKILIEDYEDALKLTMDGIAHYGTYRELFDLKRILERKRSINASTNEVPKLMITLPDFVKRNLRKDLDLSSESEYSTEENSISSLSLSSKILTQSSDLSNEISSDESDETISTETSSTECYTTTLSEKTTKSSGRSPSKLSSSNLNPTTDQNEETLITSSKKGSETPENETDLENTEVGEDGDESNDNDQSEEILDDVDGEESDVNTETAEGDPEDEKSNTSSESNADTDTDDNEQ